MKKEGVYVAFEGVPKCGKSTQANLLYEAVSREFPNRKVVLTKEPGGSEVADAIRKLVQGTQFREPMDPVCEAYLYAASRSQTLRTVVRPVVESGGIVIADRSVYSSMAIQGKARGLGTGIVQEINAHATAGLLPERVFFINTFVETCHKRAQNEFDGTDKFDGMDLTFFQAVHQGYLTLSFGETFKTFSGDGTIEEIHGQIFRSMLELLNGTSPQNN